MEVKMKKQKYNHTKKEAVLLWDIVMKCSVDSFNNELTDKALEKYIARFRTNIDKLLKKHKI